VIQPQWRKPSGKSLTTISYNTLDALREEDESAPQQSVARHASQEVGEELISTCVTPTRIKTIQNVLSKPDTERHLCALKLLPHFFSKEEQPRSQGLSSLPPLVVGRKTLVAAGHVTTQNLGGKKICCVGGVAECFVWLM